LVSAFVGLKERGAVKFLETPTKNFYAGEVYVNPFGSYSYYSSRKGNKSRMIYVPPSISGYTVVHIKKVFKGQLKYRTTRLYDGTWYESCRWWGGESRCCGCEIIKTPRIGWVDEARFDGVSADGKRATFQYGPVGNGVRDWANKEWDKLPVGVQIE
jgi:hypothetical protein